MPCTADSGHYNATHGRNSKPGIFFYLNINQLDALTFHNEFISRLYIFRTYVLIVRRPKLYYTASGIITPVGGHPVHR